MLSDLQASSPLVDLDHIGGSLSTQIHVKIIPFQRRETMSVTEDILRHQLEADLFYNEDQMVSGIARRAVDQGFDTLSPAQRRVLERFLSKKCCGYTDPAEHVGCDVILEGGALLEAYEDADDPDSLQCEACRAERDFLAYRAERIERE
ncbi:hypothetical protein [Aeromonas bestiarum]|uniref:hypothetical protein n=1 Tax=Aeromonas bestiarum TaxID=105751 RepID=UPI0032B30F14